VSERLLFREKETPLVVTQIGDKTVSLDGFGFPTAFFPKDLLEGQSVRVTITIESPHTRSDWSRAYTKQGVSDLSVYRHLTSAGASINDCHRLHYLQMASEKIAKGYQFRYTNKSIEALSSSHAGLPEFINSYCQSAAMKSRYAGRTAQLETIRNDLYRLGTELEHLAPAIERQRSPTNVEYPWSNGVTLTVPCDHAFPVMRSYGRDTWSLFEQMLDNAATDLLR
jgi:DNA-binding transcriptional MerR regulator